MIVKALKHKTLPETFGHIVHTSIGTAHIWPSNIPDLFPSSADINTIREINRYKEGNWRSQIDQYEMVGVEVTEKHSLTQN